MNPARVRYVWAPGGSPADAGFAPVCGSTHITRVPGGSPAGAGFALYVCGVYMYVCVDSTHVVAMSLL